MIALKDQEDVHRIVREIKGLLAAGAPAWLVIRVVRSLKPRRKYYWRYAGLMKPPARSRAAFILGLLREAEAAQEVCEALV